MSDFFECLGILSFCLVFLALMHALVNLLLNDKKIARGKPKVFCFEVLGLHVQFGIASTGFWNVAKNNGDPCVISIGIASVSGSVISFACGPFGLSIFKGEE